MSQGARWRWGLNAAIAAALALLAGAVPATPAAAREATARASAHVAASPVYVAVRPESHDCPGPLLEHAPRKIAVACTAPAEWIDGISWSSFDGPQATGTGTYRYLNCVAPSCHYHTTAADLVLYRVGYCPAKRLNEYTLGLVTTGGSAPKRLRSQMFAFDCVHGVEIAPPGTPPPSSPTGACETSVPVFAHVVAVGECLRSVGGGRYQSAGQLRVNGIDFVPAGNGVVTLDVRSRRVTATGPGAIKIGTVPVSVWASSLDFDLAAPLRFTVLGGQNAPRLLGFPLQNVLVGHWDPNKDATDLKGSVSLAILGDNVTAGIELSSDNEHGLSLDSLEITLAKASAPRDPNHHAGELCDPDNQPPSGFDCVGTAGPNATVPITWALEPLQTSLVKLGGWLPIDELELSWDKAHGIWSGHATLSLAGLFGGEGEGRVLPSAKLGIAISVFPFVFDYGSLQLDHLNVALPGGEVFLQTLALELHLHPQLEVGGKLTISAGPAILGHTALTIDAGFDYKRGATQGYKVTLNGDAQIAGQVTLGSAFVTYDSTDGGSRVSFGGQLGGNWGPVQAQLNVNGDVNSQHFEGTGDAQLTGFGVGVSGRAVISDAGFGACGHAFFTDIGFKHLFSTGETDFNGCDFSGLYTISGASARDGTARAASATTVPAGRIQEEFAAVGATAPPSVVLTGPGGEQLKTPSTADRITASQHALAIADTGSHTVYFIVQHPAAGTWTMSPGTGVPPVRYERADPWLNPAIRAHVTGSLGQRALSWRLRSQPGQTVSFLEQGTAVDRTLAAAVGARGRVTFAPARGPGGTRRIVALIEQDGLLRERLTVATFRAPSPRLARPRSATYRVRRGILVVNWIPTHGASGYEIGAALARAGLVRIDAAAGQRQIRVTLPAGASIRRVTVAAVYGGRDGPPASAHRRR